jgi:hypothetical protein
MTPKRAVTTAIGVLALYSFGVVGFYAWTFRDSSFAAPDPAAWGQFGDYLAGLLNPALAALNVAVIVYLAVEVQRLSEAQKDQKLESAERLRTAVELHREWNNEGLYHSRTSAGKLVRKFPDKSYFEIEEEVPYEEAAHIWVVVGFFQRLEFLAKHGKLESEMVRELFGELFIWWWVVSFSSQLDRCDCDAKWQMTRLKQWFYVLTTEEQRAPWLERANRDLQQAREAAKLPPVGIFV